MTAFSRLCAAVEATPGLAAVEAHWRAALGDAFAWAAPLLHPTDAVARVYPRAGRDRRPYRVVVHDLDADECVGISPDDPDDRVPLTREQLVVWELRVDRLAARITGELGLSAGPGPVPGLPHVYQLGVHDPFAPGEVWVFMSLTADPRAVARAFDGLAARHDKPFLLLTPTRAGWGAVPAAARHRGKLAAMATTFVAGDADGSLALAVRPEALFAAGSVPVQGPPTEGSRVPALTPLPSPADLITPSEQATLLGWSDPDDVQTLKRLGRLRAAFTARGIRLGAGKVTGQGNKTLVPRGLWEDAAALYRMCTPPGASPDAAVKAIEGGDRPVNGSGQPVSYWCVRCDHMTRTADREPACAQCGKHDRLTPVTNPGK